MRIGVVSDTHNHLANVARIVALLDDARVERVGLDAACAELGILRF